MANPIVHFEITGTDRKKLQDFYGKLFDWKIQDDANMHYGMVDTASGAHGIGGGIGDAMGGPPRMTIYAEVDDLQKYLDRAVELGGKMVMPVTDMGMVVFAMFSDPEGHIFGMVKADPNAPRI